MKFSGNLLLVCLISGSLVPGYSQTKQPAKTPHLTIEDPNPLACSAAVAPPIPVNLCDLAVQMLPEQKAAKQKAFWTRKGMKQLTVTDHPDVTLRLPDKQEVLWYCQFSKPRRSAGPGKSLELDKPAKFNYTPGESLSFAIVDIKEVQTEDCDDRPLAPADNPFCTDFVNHPHTGELHSGVPRNNAAWHTYKYSFVIGSGRWIPPTATEPGHFFPRSIPVDPHLIVTGSGTGGTDKVIRKGGKCSPDKSGQNDNKQ